MSKPNTGKKNIIIINIIHKIKCVLWENTENEVLLNLEKKKQNTDIVQEHQK